MGPAVPRLEAAVAQLAGATHGIACASGTDALLLPLMALDLEPGDEVIAPAFTFFATAGTIHNAGGTPVFVDIEPGTFNLDPAAVEAAITPRRREAIPPRRGGHQLAARLAPGGRPAREAAAPRVVVGEATRARGVLRARACRSPRRPPAGGGPGERTHLSSVHPARRAPG